MPQKGRPSHSDDPALNTIIDAILLQDVYAFDTYSSTPLRSCPVAEKNKPIQIYVYNRDPHWRSLNLKRARKDWFALVISTVKLAECIILFEYGATQLCWVTGLNWLFFFLSAALLQTLGLSREYNDYTISNQSDFVAGKLPTPQIPGEECKILLGVPENVRLNLTWRLVWAAGGLLTSASLIAIYMLLGRESANVVYAWIGFQLLWLILRSVFFHLAEETDDVKFAVAPLIEGKTAPPEIGSRLLALALALSKYQILLHPRNPVCYKEDLQSPAAIRHSLRAANYTLQPSFLTVREKPDGGELEVSVVAVFGDTLLSSIAWLRGNRLTGMDLYDSCLVVLKVSGQTFIIPSARVLSGPPQDSLLKDEESRVAATYIPRGGSNDGRNICWWYWVPCDDGRWLQFLSVDMNVIGTRNATVYKGTTITRKLQVGDLFISLTDISDVEDIVKKSTIAGEYICDLVL